MKRQISSGFTLIEVLISVTILAIVATGLIQISSHAKKNFQFLQEKANFSSIASIPFIHNDQKYHNEDIALYDFLKDDYPQIEDDIRKYLKNYKIYYSQKEFETYSPFSEDNKSQNSEENQQIELTIIYDQIVITHNKKESALAYKIYIPIGEVKSE